MSTPCCSCAFQVWECCLICLSARLAADVTKMLLSAQITACVCDRATSVLCLLARLHRSLGFASCILVKHPCAPGLQTHYGNLLTGELAGLICFRSTAMLQQSCTKLGNSPPDSYSELVCMDLKSIGLVHTAVVSVTVTTHACRTASSLRTCR